MPKKGITEQPTTTAKRGRGRPRKTEDGAALSVRKTRLKSAHRAMNPAPKEAVTRAQGVSAPVTPQAVKPVVKRPLGRGAKDETEVEKLRHSVKVAADERIKLNEEVSRQAAHIQRLESQLANEIRDNKALVQSQQDHRELLAEIEKSWPGRRAVRKAKKAVPGGRY